MRKLTRLRTLSLQDWWRIACAFGYLLEAGWRLSVRKEKLASRLVACREMETSLPTGDPRMQKALIQARYVNMAARRPFEWARCLQRSLALCLWLEHQGLQPALRLGVARKEDGLDAHAWVEYRGVVINDNAEAVAAAFTPLMPPVPAESEKVP